jgi:DNA-directed RNA polymerase specialized sigma24 family protein
MTIRGGAPGERAAAGADDLARLLTRIAARDTAAFAALYRETSAKLYGVVARILKRSDVAADVLQETYVRVWEKAGEFDSAKGSALAWMATIAHSTRCGACAPFRSRISRRGSNRPRRMWIRSARANAPKGS